MKKILICAIILAMAGTCISCGSSKKDKKAPEATTQTRSRTTQEAKTKDISLDPADYVELGEYENLKVKVPAVTVTDEEIESHIEEDLADNVEDVDITDREDVQEGDFVDAEWTMKFDGEVNDDYSNNVEIKMGDHQLDFLSQDMDCDEALIGKKIGDKVTVTGTVDKDYEDPDVAGKEVEITIKIKGLSRQEMPELTDDFVKEYLGYNSVKEYKKAIKEEILAIKEDSADDQKKQLLWSQVVDNAKQIKDFPEDIMETAIYNVNVELEEDALEEDMDIAEYLKSSRNMTVEEYATESLKSRCVCDLLAKEYKLSVTDQELEDAIEEAVEEEFGSEEAFLGYHTREDVRENLLYDKVMEKLMETADFEKE